jgi:hypothetical protein
MFEYLNKDGPLEFAEILAFDHVSSQVRGVDLVALGSKKARYRFNGGIGHREALGIDAARINHNLTRQWVQWVATHFRVIFGNLNLLRVRCLHCSCNNGRVAVWKKNNMVNSFR